MVEVDICERDVGFVLSIGPVSLWLQPSVALDTLETLARAIAVSQSQAAQAERVAPKPPAAPRRRIFS